MAQQQQIAVRRAKAGDVGNIAAFVNRARQGQLSVGEQAVIERFGNAGFLLAERGGNLVGMLGWRAENLVVRVTDFLVWPASERIVAGRVLFTEMERAAAVLQCEAALLLSPRPASPELIEFCGMLGYEPEVVAGLPKAWRDAAREAQIGDDDEVLLKQLREDRVLRPL
jgi:N-acetylglutamate synthase-like GNAT family acetyltransferase